MEFRDLQYILTIAKYGKVSYAARELYIAQSSLSQFLKNYEEKLGFPLFTRTNRGLIPTEKGELFLDTAREIMNLQHNFYARISDIDNLRWGTVIFSVSTFRAPYLLPKVIPPFMERYPNIKLKIQEASMEEQEALLSKGLVDAGFLTTPSKAGDLVFRHLIDEEILLAVPKDEPLCEKAHPAGPTGHPWIRIEDISHRRFLLYSVNHRLRTFAENLFASYHLEPEVVQSHSSFETLIRLADIGLGITFLPETYLEPRSGLRYFSIGEIGQFRPLLLGYPSGRSISKATEAFSDIVEEVLKQK